MPKYVVFMTGNNGWNVRLDFERTHIQILALPEQLTGISGLTYSLNLILSLRNFVVRIDKKMEKGCDIWSQGTPSHQQAVGGINFCGVPSGEKDNIIFFK